jgi:hypothetical protein
MYKDYDFPVEAIAPSGLIQYQSGHATSTRKFKVPCKNAEEFALRQMGKFLLIDTEDLDFPAVYKVPVLPAPFPFDGSGILGYGQLNLVATSFSINPVAACCFNIRYLEEDSGDERLNQITDPTAIGQMERYFYTVAEEAGQDQEDIDAENSECDCEVIIGYEENPCDCASFNNSSGEWEVHAELLPNTCIAVERNPAYEMFTLPNAALVWKDLPSGTESEQAARQLKADSYAYKIIPKADIIVSWHNVPVKHLCAIENHLKEFRGTVNDLHWGDVLFCDAEPVEPSACGCAQYEPETIMFVDFQEDRAKRTDCFGGMAVSNQWNMNTTTLKLFFKQKRIERETPTASYSDSDDCPDGNDLAYGWNHLFLDRAPELGGGQWARVAISGGTEDPVFPLKSFSNIMYPDL